MTKASAQSEHMALMKALKDDIHFSGSTTGTSLPDVLQKFETRCKGFNVTDDSVKLNAFILILQDSALSEYLAFEEKQKKENKTTTYADLVKHMKTLFIESVPTVLENLKTMNMKEEESIQQFIDRFRKATTQCLQPFDPVHLTCLFYNALTPALKNAMMSHPKNVPFETYAITAREVANNVPKPAVPLVAATMSTEQVPDSAIVALTKQLQQLQSTMGRPHNNGYNNRTSNKRANNTRCYNCEGFGHLSRDCPTPQRRQDQNNNRRSNNYYNNNNI